MRAVIIVIVAFIIIAHVAGHLVGCAPIGWVRIKIRRHCVPGRDGGVPSHAWLLLGRGVAGFSVWCGFVVEVAPSPSPVRPQVEAFGAP